MIVSFQYYDESHGVIYVVDSSDKDRLEESRLAFGKCIYKCQTLKGHWTIFWNFILAEFHLSCKMQLLIYESKKKKSKIPSEN